MPHVEILAGNQVAMVDAEDVALVAPFRWHTMGRGNTSYAVFSRRVGGRLQTVLMHRLILGVTSSQVHVDHRNGEGLDNRRSNLRLCSRGENIRNSRTRKDNVSGLKGVGFNRRLRRYTAHIFANKRTKYLGSFATPEEAHAAYCRAATEHFQDFARFE